MQIKVISFHICNRTYHERSFDLSFTIIRTSLMKSGSVPRKASDNPFPVPSPPEESDW